MTLDQYIEQHNGQEEKLHSQVNWSINTDNW